MLEQTLTTFAYGYLVDTKIIVLVFGLNIDIKKKKKKKKKKKIFSASIE